MEETTLDVYEAYFKNESNWLFSLRELSSHNCIFCSGKKFIVEYLEHLKIFGFSVKTADLFISSIRENGILSQNVKGFWRIKKHAKYELYVIEHLAITQEDEQVVEEF